MPYLWAALYLCEIESPAPCIQFPPDTLMSRMPNAMVYFFYGSGQVERPPLVVSVAYLMRV